MQRSRKLIIGCGYLGRRVAREWIAAGEAVAALTRSAENGAELARLGVEPLIGDVMDPASLSRLPPAETVLYAVGLDRTAGYSQRAVYVDGLAHVLRQLAASRPNFLYVSSTSVYGQNAGEFVDETSECRPESSNGQVCLDAERLLQSVLPTAKVLRLAGIYGPGRLIARIEQLRSGALLTGNPEAWLNLIHVDDAVTAVLACEQRAEPGTITLVSDDRPHRRREYYELLALLIGAPAPRFEEHGLDEAAPAALNKRCSNRRLRDILGVSLRFPTIAEGLPEVIRERGISGA